MSERHIGSTYRVLVSTGSMRARVRRRASTLCLAATASLGMAGVATAVEVSWVGPPGVPAAFESPANWSPSAPMPGDDAFIDNGGIATVSTFDGQMNTLRLGTTTGGSGTIQQTGGSLRTSVAGAAGIAIGDSPAGGATGTFTLSGGAVNTNDGFFVVGKGANTGFATISGGTINAWHFVASWQANSQSTINQTGGQITTLFHFLGSEGVGASNTYNMSGGTISTGAAFAVGSHGPGTFNLSNDGVVNAAGDIHIGLNATVGAAGILNMSGGTINGNNHMLVGNANQGTLNLSGGNINVARFNMGQNANGLGYVNQTGGTVTASAAVVIGETSHRANLYEISGGTLYAAGSANIIRIASSNADGSLLIRDNGLVVSDNDMYVGSGTPSFGTLTMTGGTLALGSPGINGDLFVGVFGTGTANITGGTVTTDIIRVAHGAASNGTLNIGGTANVTVSNTTMTGLGFDTDIGGTGTINVSGGNFTAGTVIGRGMINVSGGTMTATSIQQPAVAVSGGVVQVLPDGTAAATSRIENLTTSGTGQFDLTNNALVVDYSGASPLGNVRSQIVSAYAGGAWTGPGITSSLANNSTHGLGYGEASSLAAVPEIFGTVDDDAVLVRYTRYGDADLNGVVNLQDFNRLAANFGSSTAVWTQGDFTYDGLVNLADFNRLAANFGQQAGPDGPTPDDWAALASAIPEPSSLLALAATGGLLLARRRRDPLT